MSSSRAPSPRAYLPTAFFLVVLGWGGLLLLLNFSLPTLGPRWLFFFLIVIGATGAAMPVAAFLHQRFASDPPASPSVVLRQSLWFGIYVSMLAWLQYGRVFTVNLALIFLLGFSGIEFLLRLRERSRWRT